MADLGSALFARLNGNTSAANRVYPRVRPQNTQLPAITYTVPGGDRDQHLKGYTGTRRPRVQIDCWAATYAAARALADAAVAILSPPGSAAGIQFGHSSANEPRDLGEDTATGFVHRASVDLLVEYQPA